MTPAVQKQWPQQSRLCAVNQHGLQNTITRFGSLQSHCEPFRWKEFKTSATLPGFPEPVWHRRCWTPSSLVRYTSDSNRQGNLRYI